MSLLYIAQRLWVSLSGRCLLDSDEGIVLIAANDILHGQLPVFFYGQDYLGSFQSFAAVPFVTVLGVTPLALRLTAIFEGVALLWIWRWILRKWGSPEIWVLFALLLVFAPEFATVWTLRSRGGIETLLLGSLWIASLTTILSTDRVSSFHWFRLGLLTGIAWWTSQLTVFFIAAGLPLLLLTRSGRSRMTQLDTAEHCETGLPDWALGILYLLSIGLLAARGTVPYRSPMSAVLLKHRSTLIGLCSVTLFVYLIWATVRRRKPWPLLLGTGTLLGYLPVLSVVLVKESLYNTTAINRATRFWSHLMSHLLIAGGSLVGLQSETLERLAMPLPLIVFVVGVYAAAILLFYLDLTQMLRRKQPLGLLNLFLAGAVPIGLLIFTHVESRSYVPPRYALYPVFLMTLMVAGLFLNIRHVSRVMGWLLLAAFLATNCVSVYQRQAHPVIRTTMVAETDQVILDFLKERGISAACTSLDSPDSGYWNAYRLSASSGDTIFIHPILHMPRIERYRAALERAEHCAILTPDPERTEVVFQRNNINYSRFDHGGMTVLCDFDKTHVDRLKLIDYRRSLREERTR